MFWFDADTLITNASVTLESLLPPEGGRRKEQQQPDLILTRDPAGYNAGAPGPAAGRARCGRWPCRLLCPASWWSRALKQPPAARPAGVWLLRNSAWSASFLDRWWAMDGFIRRKPGDTKSGDNDALKALLAAMDRCAAGAAAAAAAAGAAGPHGMPWVWGLAGSSVQVQPAPGCPRCRRRREYEQHVAVAPQCAFNSYLWKGSLRQWLRYFRDPWTVSYGGCWALGLAGEAVVCSAAGRCLDPLAA